MKESFNNARMIPTTAQELEIRLGVLLVGGLGLHKACQEIANTTEPAHFSTAFRGLCNLLERGESCTLQHFAQFLPFFSDRSLYVLASPFSDKIKGELLTSWRLERSSSGFMRKNIFIAVITFCFSIAVLIAHINFVLPQFYEITYGAIPEAFYIGAGIVDLDVVESITIALMVGVCILILMLAFLAAPLERLFGVSRHRDRASLYQMLALVPHSLRLEAMAFFSSARGVFRSEANTYLTFSTKAMQGTDLKSAAASAGLGAYFAWFLHPRKTEVHGAKDSEDENEKEDENENQELSTYNAAQPQPTEGYSLLISLAELHLSKVNNIKHRVALVSENMMLLLNGLAIGLSVWYVFYMLQVILQGVI